MITREQQNPSTGLSVRSGDSSTSVNWSQTAGDVVLRHGPAILRTARRFSSCAADAEDAYQRGLEILLTKAPSSEPSELVPWLHTVVKHEALAVGRSRYIAEPTAFEDREELLGVGEEPADHFVRSELLGRGQEAMQRLKPDEIRCLLMKAEGLTYQAISEATGFTMTKVNRCLTEGRRSFRERMTGIESGSECLRIEPLLSRMADDELSAAEIKDAALHLSRCLTCKATLREYKSAPARAAAFFPLALLPADSSGFLQQVSDFASAVAGQINERIASSSATAHQWVELAGAKKAATAATLAASLAISGGVAVQQTTGSSQESDAGRAPPTVVAPEPTAPSPLPVLTVGESTGGDASNTGDQNSATIADSAASELGPEAVVINPQDTSGTTAAPEPPPTTKQAAPAGGSDGGSDSGSGDLAP